MAAALPSFGINSVSKNLQVWTIFYGFLTKKYMPLLQQTLQFNFSKNIFSISISYQLMVDKSKEKDKENGELRLAGRTSNSFVA